MSSNNLSKAILFRPTKNQEKALIKLDSIGFNKSKLIRLALDEYLYKNYRIIIKENNRLKYPF